MKKKNGILIGILIGIILTIAFSILFVNIYKSIRGIGVAIALGLPMGYFWCIILTNNEDKEDNKREN